MTIQKRNDPASLVLWHVFAAAAIAVWLPLLKFHLPIMRIKASELVPFEILLAGFLASALLPAILGRAGRPARFGGIACSILSLFGLIFLYFIFARVDSTRVFMVLTLLAALVLVPLGWSLRNWRWAGVVAFAGAALVGAFLGAKKGDGSGAALNPHVEESVFRSAFYNVRITTYKDYVPMPAVRGGGLTRLGDRFVLLSGDGYLYSFGWAKGSEAIDIKALPYRVPVNGDEFAKDTTGGPWRTPSEGDARSTIGEDAGSQVIAWWFRATGILIQERGDSVRVFVSHYHWNHDAFCWTERVSVLEGPREQFLAGDRRLSWRTIFESTPCLPIKGEGARRGTPFCGHFGGGRMVMFDDDTLMLAVGDFGFNGVSSKQMVSQDPTASYGKTMLIHLGDGRSEMYTLGHRNPQGLYKDPQGRIWDTEQGPQGGDELNLIKKGLNYGWPIVTYGVDYGTFTWPLDPKNGDHEGFEAPYFSWIPDIGVSDLIGVEKDLFPVWKGDLLVTSLAANTIFRVRVRNERVVYTELIPLGKRIRDITEGADGRIVLWCDDDDSIVVLRPLTGNSAEVAFATYCSGCHKVGDGTSHRIGPDLWGVVGRKVASAVGYRDYSAGLKTFGGEWNEERLDRFIANPQATVPGTAMEFAGVDDAAKRRQIIQYLKTAKKVESR